MQVGRMATQTDREGVWAMKTVVETARSALSDHADASRGKMGAPTC